MKFFILFISMASFLFAIDIQTLKDRAENKDKEFFLQLISNTEVYEDMQKIPANLKEGECYITEDYYGAREFYIIDKNDDSKEFNHPFFLRILSEQSGGSSFSNMFSVGGVTEYSIESTDETFKPYVSNTKSVRVAILKVSSKVNKIESLLNDYLLNNSIIPASIINIQLINEEKNKNLWIFYRP